MTVQDGNALQRLITESRNKFRTLVDGIGDEIFLVDRNFVITSANKTLAQRWGLHPKDIVGRKCHDVIHNETSPCCERDPNHDCVIWKTFQSARVETELRELPGQHGRPQYMEVRAMPLLDESDGVEGVIVVSRDVTVQKEAEKQIQEYNERLESEVRQRTAELHEANRVLTDQSNRLKKANQELIELEGLKRDLTHMVIHDLKGPLAEIVSNLEMLKYEKLSEIQQDMLESAEFGGREMYRMIANLLDISRMEEKKLEVAPAPIQAENLLGDLARRYTPLARLKDVRITTDVADDLPTFRTDPMLLERILINLLTNAIDNTPQTGVITLRAETEGGGWTRLAVEDTGYGIPKEIIERIFEKFSQGREGQAKTGSGLGLTFCRMAVDALGGRIEVESDPGRRTVFTVSLPDIQPLDSEGS